MKKIYLTNMKKIVTQAFFAWLLVVISNANTQTNPAGALNFDGVNDYVSIPALNLNSEKSGCLGYYFIHFIKLLL